jgi:uncharacterized membrane protein YkoI
MGDPMRSKRLLSVSAFLAAAVTGLAADSSQPVPLTQAPPAVQKTIAAQIGGGKLEDIYQSDENGEPIFDVGFTTQAGQEHGFSVAPDGTLLSTEIGLAEAPAAVQKTIQAEAAGWGLDGIDRNVEASGATYDVEVTKNGRTQNFTVDDDGTLLSIAVPLEETPAAVQKAIQAQANGAQVGDIDKNVDEPEITFDVETSKAGVPRNFTVAADGTLVSAEVALAETPAPVQATIAAQAAGGTVKSIDENFEPDGVTYDVETVTKAGAANSFTLGAGGALLSQVVPLDQVPPAARNTIQDHAGPSKIIRIDKSLAEKIGKVFPYEVEARKDGKPFYFNVGPKGRFLGWDQ